MIMHMYITTIDDCAAGSTPGVTAIAPIWNVSTDLGATSGPIDR